MTRVDSPIVGLLDYLQDVEIQVESNSVTKLRVHDDSILRDHAVKTSDVDDCTKDDVSLNMVQGDSSVQKVSGGCTFFKILVDDNFTDILDQFHEDFICKCTEGFHLNFSVAHLVLRKVSLQSLVASIIKAFFFNPWEFLLLGLTLVLLRQ